MKYSRSTSRLLFFGIFGLVALGAWSVTNTALATCQGNFMEMPVIINSMSVSLNGSQNQLTINYNVTPRHHCTGYSSGGFRRMLLGVTAGHAIVEVVGEGISKSNTINIDDNEPAEGIESWNDTETLNTSSLPNGNYTARVRMRQNATPNQGDGPGSPWTVPLSEDTETRTFTIDQHGGGTSGSGSGTTGTDTGPPPPCTFQYRLLANGSANNITITQGETVNFTSDGFDVDDCVEQWRHRIDYTNNGSWDNTVNKSNISGRDHTWSHTYNSTGNFTAEGELRNNDTLTTRSDTIGINVQAQQPGTYTLNVQSSPITGVGIGGGTGHGGSTDYPKQVPQGTSVTLTAPATHSSGGNTYAFSSWSNCVSSTNRTISFNMPGANRTCRANYTYQEPEPNAILHVQAKVNNSPTAPVTITQQPFGASTPQPPYMTGTTDEMPGGEYVRTYAGNMNTIILEAPDEHSDQYPQYLFDEWDTTADCGSIGGTGNRRCNVSVGQGNEKTVIAIYQNSGTIEVTSNVQATWDITGPDGIITEGPPGSTNETYEDRRADRDYTMIPGLVAGYGTSTVAYPGPEQHLPGGGTIEYDLLYTELGVTLSVACSSDDDVDVAIGAPFTIEWVTDGPPETCTSADDWTPNTSKNANGSSEQYTLDDEGTYTFTIVCDGPHSQTGGSDEVTDTVTVNAIVTECSDGVDNADVEDTLADEDDPGCWGIPGDPDSYDPSDNNERNEGSDPQCDDGIDNDADGRTDANDPACHCVGDENNPDWYNPTEGTGSSSYDPTCEEAPDPTCADQLDNNADGQIDWPDDFDDCDGPWDAEGSVPRFEEI